MIFVPVPDTTLTLPRERPNPVTVSTFGLGYAFRRWRDRPVLARGGTIVLVHGLERRFSNPSQRPYRLLFAALRIGRDREILSEVALGLGADPRALDLYRGGHSCHPLLPFADWEACRPAIERAGSVMVAGCRDATAARQFGFLPSHGIGHALELVSGHAGEDARAGFLLGPPYAALRPAPLAE